MSMLFDGTSEGLVIPDITIAGDFTMFGRVRTTGHPGATFATAFAGDNSPTAPRNHFGFNAKIPSSESSFACIIDGTAAAMDDFLITEHQWYDVVLTRAGTVCKAYVDGVQFDVTGVTGTGAFTLENVRIAHYPIGGNQFFFEGYVGDWGIANEEWTQAQAQDFADGIAPDAISTLLNIEVYYPLSSDLVDKTGNYADATLLNSPIFAEPFADGEHAALNGTDEMFDIPDIVLDGNFTICVRQYRRSNATVGNMTLYSTDDLPASPRNHFNIDPSRFGLDGTASVKIQDVGGDVDMEHTTTSLNAWHEYVITREGTVVKLFIDGSQVGVDETVAADAPITLSQGRIGGWGGNDGHLNFFDGFIKDWAIINEVWSAQDLTDFSADIAPDTISLLADIEIYYPLNGTTRDKTGNYRQLTSFNDPTFETQLDASLAPASTVEVKLIYQQPTSTGPQQFGSFQGKGRSLFIDSTGRFWCVYGKQDSGGVTFADTYNVAYSDDKGLTWTEEEVDDSATVGTPVLAGGAGMFAEANNGEIVLVIYQDLYRGGDSTNIYRRVAGTWTFQSRFTTSGNIVNWSVAGDTALYNHPDDDTKWILCGIVEPGGVRAPGYRISADNLGTWGTETALETPNTSSEFATTQGLQWLRNTDLKSIFCVYDRRNTNAQWSIVRIKAWDTSPVVVSQILSNQGGTNEFRYMGAHWSDVDEITVFTHKKLSTAHDLWLCVIKDVEAASPWPVMPLAFDTGTNLNTNREARRGYYEPSLKAYIGMYDQGSGIDGWEWLQAVSPWTRGELVISGTAIDSMDTVIALGTNETMDFGFLADGDARFGAIRGMGGILIGEDGGFESMWYIETDNVEYGSGSGLAVSGSETFFLTESADTPEIAVQIASIGDPVLLGGRCSVRTEDGYRWTTFKHGTSGYPVAYRSENGMVWAQVGMETKLVEGGMAMCVGAGGVAVVAYARNNTIRCAIHTGGLMVFQGKKTTGSVDSESFQILYDGTTYHLIYADRTSGGNRRVRHATSSDLNSWSVTTIYDNSNTNYKPHKSRRIAAFIDAAGDIQLFFTKRVSSIFRIFHTKWTGASWSSHVEVVQATNFEPSGFSATYDAYNGGYLAYLAPGSLYANRAQIYNAYFSAGWQIWSISDPGADADQNNPSILSINGVNFRCWWTAAQHSEGTNLVAITAIYGSDWIISEAVAISAVGGYHGYDGPDGHNYQRLRSGYALTFEGSVNYFEAESSNFMDGVEANETLEFTEAADIQGFGFGAETVSFSEAAIGLRAVTGNEVFSLVEQANISYILPPTVEEFSLSEQGFSSGKFGTSVVDFGHEIFGFTEFASRLVQRAGEASEVLSFTEAAGIGFDVDATDELEFGEEADIIKRIIVGGVESFSFVEEGSEVGIIQVPQAETFSLSEGGFYLPIEGCDTSFVPDPAIPVNENEIQHTYFAGPYGVWTYSVRLKRPDYGDKRKSALQTIVQRSRGGNIRLFKRNPTYKQLDVGYTGLSRAELFQIEELLENTKGQFIRYIDRHGHVWKVFVIDENIDFGMEATDRGGTVQVTMEGSVTGASS